MTRFIAALPMYDWPERAAEVESEWIAIRDRLRGDGLPAPERLVRRNADLPPVPGGIRDAAGAVIAPDPATLPPDRLDLPALWMHPNLLFAQACWGPMEAGLAAHVQPVGQPDYSGIEGGRDECYSSAILMRADSAAAPGMGAHVSAPADGLAVLPLDLMRGKRFAYNGPDSMSGLIALERDLAACGEGLDIFAERIETGGHRNSIMHVAEGAADVASIDCRSWGLAGRYEPAATRLHVVGWTARRKGLLFITSRSAPAEQVAKLRRAVAGWQGAPSGDRG